MDLAPGYTIEDSLADALLHAGDVAHSIAVDNHALRGSNGFTFGAERYHRARQLARGPLEDHGFDLIQNGAGLMGRRGNLTLAFATARGRVSDGPVTFDTESSQVRRDASVVNSIAFQDGLDLGLKLPRVFHYVWCGTPTQGLTGVFTGCLVKLTGGRAEWAEVRVVYDAEPVGLGDDQDIVETTYASQPEPELDVKPRRTATERSEDGK
ncbi:hypothetical protein Cch01nite_24710 [Cellulomonas chitinilytica]|uniref:Uncharacterized protein n=1 Tax=Cellulomonas chitinilytica TaxID=398759 RepID=A0A919P1V2_9CELL|nr:hypothetical protein [Cellulomonas chitinilytica]GIG21747.1 hypothetical protein Cch01nite_24710 [Cellulomonas chitinilytica]